ncbi:MAG: signal peptidase II [Oscillospiraceae bacterium]|nr:signal peptidase II [Oscillospiraceae bacterium]
MMNIISKINDKMNKLPKKVVDAAACCVFISIIALTDQLIKSAVARSMTEGQTKPFIDGFMQWTYSLNSGASWSILSGRTGFLIFVALAGISLGAYFLITDKIRHATGFCAFVLIVGGAAGNLIDRLFRGGLVIDYIDIRPWFNFPIFNFADCCITVGAVFMVVYVIFFFEDRPEDETETELTDETGKD